MKAIIGFFILITMSTSASAFQCAALFSGAKFDRQLLNSLKRIHNYDTFDGFVLVDAKHNNKTLVIFDIPKNGRFESRDSLNGHIEELVEFSKELRFVYDSQTKNHILSDRLVSNPAVQRINNLMTGNLSGRDILENLKKSDTIAESYELEIFQATVYWLSRSKAEWNILVLPEGQRDAFVENTMRVSHLSLESLPTTINNMDPINH